MPSAPPDAMDATRAPAATVVVATRNRAALLPRLLGALARQQADVDLEVVVVDDGSTDDTHEVLTSLAASAAFEVRVLRQARSGGPAAARNVGWRAARAPLVAFTDDDCVPQPGWLAGIVHGLADHDIAQGRTTADPHQPRTGWFSRAPESDHERGLYETCNIGYRAATLEAVGGFDERFGTRARGRRRGYVAPIWGEDTDLAWRAREQGASTTFVPDAVVWHDLRRGRLRDELRELPRRAGNVVLVKRHPGVRASFASPWFVDPAHAPAAASVVGIAVVALRPRSPAGWLLAAAAGAAWARRRGVYYPKRLWPRTLPQWYVVDVADVAIMAAASARHRTLLL